MSNRWEPRTSSNSGSRSSGSRPWRAIVALVIFVIGIMALGGAGLLVTGVAGTPLCRFVKVQCDVPVELIKPDVFMTLEASQALRITMIPESGKEIEVLSMVLTNDGSAPMTVRTPRVDVLVTGAGKPNIAGATIGVLPNTVALFRIEATQIDPIQPTAVTVTIRVHSSLTALVGGPENLSVFRGTPTGWMELYTSYLEQVQDSDQWQWFEFETDEFAYFAIR